ncbi:MAG: HIT family protein [Bacteroidota bacterium]
MASIFTKIIKGEIPCHKIAESEDYFAFLDINPWSEGHTLVIPKKEIDYIFDLDDDTYEGLMKFSKRVAAAVEKAIDCKRIGVLVEGLEVPHAHVHLIPIVSNLIPKKRPRVSQEELAKTAEKIRAYF